MSEVKPAKEAKPAKKVEAKKTEKAEKKPRYDINYIATALGKKANIVRISLRSKKIKKPGKSYIWPNKSDADEVIKKLKAAA